MLAGDIRQKIAAMGHELSPSMLAEVRELYAADQCVVSDSSAIVRDLPYGPDPRHVLDLYGASPSREAMPIMIWVHGGGFVRGAKSEPDHPFEAHMGHFASRNGFLGAVINYRLAPAHGWPAGGEDVGRAIAWLRAKAESFGGDPGRILLVGTSAGAAHIATYLQLHPDTVDVAGVVLLSGIYGYTPPTDPARDLLYFGADPASHLQSSAAAALERSTVPMMVTCAEYDPQRFQVEFISLLEGRLKQKGKIPRGYIALGHNHFSQPYHIGTADTRLSDEIMAFATDLFSRSE
jgi:triacylglycerol lipase